MPCSRVGHIFKDFHPEDNSLNALFSENVDKNKLTERNIKRAIAIWTDQYRVLFDMYSPNDKEVDVSSEGIYLISVGFLKIHSQHIESSILNHSSIFI